jgi:hypothetical protein
MQSSFSSSVFSKQDHERLVERINALTPDKKPLWGKMNAAQMLAHCQEPLKIMLGDVQGKRTILGILFGGWARRKFSGPAMFDKNLPTDKTFVITNARQLDEERGKLLALLERTVQRGSAVVSQDPHPFFGVLTAQEWDTIQSKHLDHHLRQFGV